jgi:uncharacterized membrane protein
MQRGYNEIAGKRVQRLEAISDGVFAIALTLLVLDIHVPLNTALHTEGELWGLLSGLAPKFLSYLLSFMTLGIFWTGNALHFQHIDKSDRNLNWLTLFFLMFVSLLPFSTAFLSEYIHFRIAIGVYWLNIFALGMMMLVHWNYAEQHDFLSIKSSAERLAISKAIRNRIVVAQTLYAVSALLCFINTYLSMAVTVLIQLYYVLAPLSWKIFKRHKKR